MRRRSTRRRPGALLAASLALACATEVVDYEDGRGVVDGRGRPVADDAPATPADLDFETEPNTEIVQDEAIEDAIRDSER